MFIAHGKYRLFERSSLDSCEEIRKFLTGGQWIAFLCAGVAGEAGAEPGAPKVGGILAKRTTEASGAIGVLQTLVSCCLKGYFA